MSNQIRVLVLGTGVNGLGVLRALHKFSEIDIGAVNFNKRDAGRFTRLAKIVNWPDPVNEPNEFLNRLYDLSRNENKTILFPTRDKEVDILAELSDSLPENLQYYRNPIDTVRALADKSLVSTTAARAGLHAPRTTILSEKINPRSTGFQFPIIIKPLDSCLSQTHLKNILVECENEFEKMLSDHNHLLNQAIIQEFIPGDDNQIYQCNLLIGAGAGIVGAIEFQKLRQYLPYRGTTSYGQTTLHRKLVPFCQQLAEEAGYQGLMSVEFKRDSKKSRWVFIEVNLRLPAYNAVFEVTGVNLAYLYVRSLIEKNTHSVFAWHTATWMHEQHDLANILTRKVKVPLRVWCHQLRNVNSFANWYIKDPLPGLYSLWRILLVSLRKVLRIIGLPNKVLITNEK